MTTMLFCIVGTSRCGTTVLRQMMHEHPELVVFRETHWLPKMVEFFGTERVAPERLLSVVEKTTWDTGEDLLSVNLAFSAFESREELIEALRRELDRSGYLTIQEFSSVLVRVLFDWEGRWGDKTPDYGFYMGMIQSLWPRCRFVHIIREGFATAESMARHPASQLMVSNGFDNWCSLSYDHLFERYRASPLSLDRFVSSWRRRLNRIRDEATRLRAGTYLEVRHERLVQDPKATLARLCAFSDLPAPEDWLEACSALVHSPRRRGDLDPHFLRGLEAEDLLALNLHSDEDEGSRRRWRFPPDTSDDTIATSLREAELTGEGGSAEEALDLAVQVMATHACHRDRQLLARAHHLAILASRRCEAREPERHWVHSAEQHGLSIPCTTVTPA